MLNVAVAVALVAINGNCSTARHDYHESREEYRSLQLGVNEGHRPLLQDSWEVANQLFKEYAFSEQEAPKSWKATSERVGKTQAMYEYTISEHRKVRILLKRPSWLLRAAGSYDLMIWVPISRTDVRCR